MTDERHAEKCAQWAAIFGKCGLDIDAATTTAAGVVARIQIADALCAEMMRNPSGRSPNDFAAELNRHCDELKAFINQRISLSPGPAQLLH